MPAYLEGKSEKEVLEGCIRGEHKYQKLLYDAFSSKMFGICLRYAKNYHLAEDLLQEGFIRVFNNIQTFRFQGSFEGWLKRIIINTAVEFLRQSVRIHSFDEVNGIEYKMLDDDIKDEMEASELLRIIQSLSDGYRTVFNLYAIEGFSHQEIGKMLGISEGTSKSQYARAKVILQKLVLETKQYKNYESAAQSR